MVRPPSAEPKFSVGLPNDPEMLGRLARRAEELGFEGAWTQDSVNASNFSLDALHVLSYVAAVTERMRVGVSVLYAARRNPASLARELATIDQLSRGRLTVGIGLGNTYHRAALEAVGIPTDRPVRRFVECIDIMRALWTQEEASFDGETYSFSGIRSQPKPVQKPGPPIRIGARAEASLVRAVHIADGWSGAGPTSSAEFLEHFAVVRRALDEHGRDPAEFAVAKDVYIAVEDSRARALEHLVPIFDRSFQANPVYDAAGMADRVAVFGTVDDCVSELKILLDAGVDEVILHPMYDHLNQLEALAAVADVATGRAG